MVVCKFWQQGSCRYGDRCRFDHPPINQGLPNGNRFAALQGPDSSNVRNPTGYQGDARANNYMLDKAVIITDLSAERPQWILSAYGPGRNAPAQLFGGPLREQSFEEMRLLHYMALSSGNPQQAVQEADKLLQASEQQMHAVLNNVDAAIEFIISAEKEHPNRIDICHAPTSGPPSTSNPFNQGSSTTSFPPSQSQSNPFGTSTQPTNSPAFGTPSTAAPTGAFGQPSALGQKPNPFGRTAPAFGAPTQPGTTGSFGRPSVLGQKPNPFGAPTGGSAVGALNSATTPFSSFAGTASAFSQLQPQQQQTANPFGAPLNPPIPSSFPPSSQPAQQNPFAQKSTQNSSAFSSQNPPSQQSPFGTTPTQLGAPSPVLVNTFVQTTASQATAPNPFNPSQLPATGNPLDVRQSGNVPQPLINGSTSVGPNGSLQQPSLEGYSNKAIGGRLNMFKGMRVVYKEDEAGYNARDGTWQKIWFPQGAPAPCKDTEMDDSEYDESIKTAYMHLHQSRSFQGGAIPMIPPRREWCMFDF